MPPSNSIGTAPAAMLLLDHNLPHQLRDLLKTYGLEAETAASKSWEQLRNGDLVTAAHGAGFDVIFTRDRRFAESASKTLTMFPAMALVVIRLPQRSWKLFSEAFQNAWDQKAATPEPGKVVVWP